MVSVLIIVKNKKFLFCKRRPDDEVYAGYWGLPGGTVEAGETPLEGMTREIKEELGIIITNVRFLKTYEYGKGKLMNVYVYEDDDFDPSTIRLNEEHTEHKFYSYYEVDNSEGFIPSSTTFLLDYIKNYPLS